MDIQALQEAGLTEGESKVYLALLEQAKIMQDIKDRSYTDSEIRKIRKLMKKAGLVGKHGNTGVCGKYGFDLSLRECKYPNINDNFKDEITCKWIDF